jgi:hypothetical protein
MPGRMTTLMANRSQTVLASAPPGGDALTDYDRAHLVTYLKLLDADATQIDWKTTARNVLLLDPELDIGAARRTYAAHLARAQWISRVGYRHLLK